MTTTSTGASPGARSVENQTSLSDGLLRQLIAVGQVDVLVGLPTLNNAATIVDVVRAVHVCFTRDFPRLRTVMINSDGGSSDGTPELVRSASFTDADRVQTSHSLRTLHRVVAPYHGLPGKLAAVRTIFAAAELTQAKAVVVLDPAGHDGDAARVTELIAPIVRGDVEFLTPRHRRHPRDGLLVTQLVRPLVRAVYGVAIEEPLASDFSCAGRFSAHCLEQGIWARDTARFGIDLWLRTEAIAGQFTIAQVWRAAQPPVSGRTTLRETVHQVVLSLLETLVAHESFWLRTEGVKTPPTLGLDPVTVPDHADWDHRALAAQAWHDIVELGPLLERVLPVDILARLNGGPSDPATPDDDLWTRIVYALLSEARSGSTGADHVANMLVPLYMWRASAFAAATEGAAPESVQSALDALAETFERLKPAFVASWSAKG